jgi:YfiH family protein
MPCREIGPLRVYQFESFPSNRLIHGILTRRGGSSPAPWASLNLGGTVGDDPDRVRENRRQALSALGLSLETIFDVWQVHSDVVVEAKGPRHDLPLQKADAIIGEAPGVGLLMRFADCVPILLVDPVRQAIGIAHAGWLGTARQVARKAVRAMVERFGSRPSDLLAGLGPSIGAHHYPVGQEVVEAVEASLGPAASAHLKPLGDRMSLDLWSANAWLLEDEGVGNIEIAGICTACDTQDWYSHRAESGRTGRFGAVLALAG